MILLEKKAVRWIIDLSPDHIEEGSVPSHGVLRRAGGLNIHRDSAKQSDPIRKNRKVGAWNRT